MSYKAIVAVIDSVERHPNADRLQVASILGKRVIVGLDAKAGDTGLYFPSDGQLSREFALANSLYRKHPETGEAMGGYLEDNRRVRIIKLRGELSDGIFLPLESLNYLGCSDDLSIGTMFDEYCGHPICGKYISVATQRAQMRSSSSKKLQDVYPTFYPVGDTTNLNYANIDPLGKYVVLTYKVHGTSGRTGYVQKLPEKKKWWEFWKSNPEPKWEYISGTRRTVLMPGAYHLKDNYRIAAHELFEGKLHKGEVVYYEIVGYDENGTPIQPPHNVTKVPEIQKEFGFITDRMNYSYGCNVGEHKVMVYRMGINGPDGDWIEYPWYKVVQRCREMNIETVPEIHVGTDFVSKQELIDTAKGVLSQWPVHTQYPIGNNYAYGHVVEGVVVRIEDDVYKFKSDWFCELEDIAKDSEKYVDADEVS